MCLSPITPKQRTYVWLIRHLALHNGASQVVQVVKTPPASAGDSRDAGSVPGQKDPLEEEMATHFVFLPWESHGQKSLVGYSPYGRKESDMTEAT